MPAKKIAISDVISKFTVVAVLDARDKHKRKMVRLKCQLCGHEIERSTQQLSQARHRKQELRCSGCKDAKFAAATIHPCLLTPKQAASAIRWARGGVRSILGTTDEDLQEDIASEAVVSVLIKLPVVDEKSGIDKLVFRMAQTLAKRRFNKPEAYFVEPKADDDGEFQDTCDNLNVPTESDDLDLSLQRASLAVLPQADQDFLIAYPTFKYSRTKAARYVELCNKVRAAMIENLSEGANATE